MIKRMKGKREKKRKIDISYYFGAAFRFGVENAAFYMRDVALQAFFLYTIIIPKYN